MRRLLSEGGSKEMNSELESRRSKGGRRRLRPSWAAGSGGRAAPLRKTTMAERSEAAAATEGRAGPAPAPAATAARAPLGRRPPAGSLRLAAFLPAVRPSFRPEGPGGPPALAAGRRRPACARPAAAFPLRQLVPAREAEGHVLC